MGGELFTDFSGCFTDKDYFNKQIDLLVKNLTNLKMYPSTTVGESVLKIIAFRIFETTSLQKWVPEIFKAWK